MRVTELVILAASGITPRLFLLVSYYEFQIRVTTFTQRFLRDRASYVSSATQTQTRLIPTITCVGDRWPYLE